MKKKNIIIVFVIILMIIVGVGVYFFIQNNDKSYKIEEVKTFNYFKVSENQKYGVIDAKGNIIIDAKYDNIDIPNPSKPVFIVYSNYDSQKGEYETQVLNDQKQKILTEYEKVLPIQVKESSSEVPYEKSVLAYEENDKYGIISYTGKVIAKARYDSIESLLYKEGSLVVSIEGKYGIINIEGKEIIKTEYDSITADGYYEEETKYQKAGFVVGKKKEEGYRYGYITNNGKMLLDTQYNEINRIIQIGGDDIYLFASKNGQVGVYNNNNLVIKHYYDEIEYNKLNDLFIVKKNNKQGIININGAEVLKLEYDYIMISGNIINTEKDQALYVYDIQGKKLNINGTTVLSIDNNDYFVTINEQNKFGVINKNYETIIENEYQYIEYAFDNYFIVTKNGKTGLIDISGREVINIEYNIIQKIKDTKILQAIKNDGNVSDFYNSKLEKTLTINNANVIIENNYVKVLNTNERKYLNKEGNLIESNNILPNNSMIAYEENGKWGFVDKQGEIKVEPIYEMVTELNSYGFAGIKKDNKWGVIDREGKIILEPKFEIEWNEPEFIGKYIKLNFGYGFYYYTAEIGN